MDEMGQYIFSPSESYLITEKNPEEFADKETVANIDGIVEFFFPERLPRQIAADSQALKNNTAKGTLPRDADNESISAEKNESGYYASKTKFKDILRAISRNVDQFTVICEHFHVDPSFRDSYYNYFSGQHFDMSRFTKRLTFLKDDWRDYSHFIPENDGKLNKAFLGTCVLYPNEARTIGRILFDPKYLMKEADPCYLRLTDYRITIFGFRLKLRAFLFQMQDRETTRCAEVTLLNILDYYGRTYNEYRTYLPSDIIRAEQELAFDRSLPARGINYHTMSRILKKFGFAPRLYSWEAMRVGDNPETDTVSADELQGASDGRTEDAGQQNDRELHRLLHYYVESGIPVAVNVLNRKDPSEPGHSLVCIGYSGRKTERNTAEALKNAIPLSGGPKLINAADYYSRYIVNDDNQTPYAVRIFDRLSLYPNLKVGQILIPLYKRMNMEASDAYDIVIAMLQHRDYGLVNRGTELKAEKTVVVRLFLASSRTYKHFRMMQSGGQLPEYREIYGKIPLPRFVWVAELFTKEAYETGGKAIGEIVLDATATTKNDVKSVIMLNYPGVISIRSPDQSIVALNYNRNFELRPFPRFEGNLKKIQPVHPILTDM